MQSLNKFSLKVFNRLFHDHKINNLLVTSFLFVFSDHYTPMTIIKTINIHTLQIKFPSLIIGWDFLKNNDIIGVEGGRVRLYSIYKHYFYYDFYLIYMFLYKYFWVISVIKRSQVYTSNYKFNHGHRQ